MYINQNLRVLWWLRALFIRKILFTTLSLSLFVRVLLKKRILYWLCALFQKKKKMCVLNFFRALLIKTIAFCIACEILRALFRNPNAFCSAYVRFLKNTTGICVGCVHSFENPGVLYQLYAFFLAKNVMFCIAYVRWSGMHLCFLFGACAF